MTFFLTQYLQRTKELMKLTKAMKAKIKLAWNTGLYDTTDLAERFKRTEAEIYNLIGRMKPTGANK